ncbi:MAG: hypothetical protein WDM96_08600 [Lacunisphaera sp.]
MPGTSGALNVIVRVKASPAFAAVFPGSGFHSSTTRRSRALMTCPSAAVPGGAVTTREMGWVVTTAAILVVVERRAFEIEAHLERRNDPRPGLRGIHRQFVPLDHIVGAVDGPRR